MNIYRIFFYAVAMVGMLAGCKTPGLVLKEVKVLEDYPSGSGLAFHNDRLYLVGDDANRILVMDKDLKLIDSIPLYISSEKRIPKKIKQDPEALTMVLHNGKPHLLVMGSGSLAPHRLNGWLIDPVSKEKTAVKLDSFYNRVNKAGIKELNIEGIASLPGGIVLSNRGNRNYRKNHLVFTSRDFFIQQDSADIRTVVVGANTDTAFFNGVSGLDYSTKSGRLLLTASTENTFSTHGDGTIGKSYLWIINEFDGKTKMSAINPQRIIDLDEQDSRFVGNKIESVCIISETNGAMELVLVADDDKGGTVLFKVSLSLK